MHLARGDLMTTILLYINLQFCQQLSSRVFVYRTHTDVLMDAAPQLKAASPRVQVIRQNAHRAADGGRIVRGPPKSSPAHKSTSFIAVTM